MEQQNKRENTEMGEVITNTEVFIERNQKTIIIVIIAVIVVALAIFGLTRLQNNRNEKANAAMFAAEQWFGNEEYQTALDGNDQHDGLIEIADKYGCTKSGNRAKYEAGVCYLYLGKYNDAIKYLKSYKGKDQLTKIEATICLGDAELELGNKAAALKYYEKAVSQGETNYLTAPAALFKAGMVYLMDGNNTKADECFQKIKKNYPESTEYSTIDKYIGLAESK